MREPESHVTPDWHLYSTPDPESLEDEVRELLISFVRAMKPRAVVEIGTYEGIVAECIGHALQVNGRGHLHTFEIDVARAQRAARRCEGLPVTVYPMASDLADVNGFPEIDLLFIDGALGERASDYRRWHHLLAPFGIAVIHDTLKYDPPRDEVARIQGVNQLWLRTPRGVTLLQRTP